jgi:hypothetical protein
MKIAYKTLLCLLPLLFMLLVDVADNSPSGISLVTEAQAIIGAPLTPLSCAGVARRTTRRAVAWDAAATTAAATTYATSAPPPSSQTGASSGSVPVGTVVQALPGGCKSVDVGGVSYSDCGGVFYKAAFQGNNLVYVVVENPL